MKKLIAAAIAFTFGPIPAHSSIPPNTHSVSDSASPGKVRAAKEKRAKTKPERKSAATGYRLSPVEELDAVERFVDRLARDGAPRKKIRWLRLKLDQERNPQFFEGREAA